MDQISALAGGMPGTPPLPFPHGQMEAAALGPPLLEARGVTLQYKTREHLVTATWRVSFDVYSGDRYILLGPSGCGKSSLLKAIGGFIRPVEGGFRLAGQPVHGPGPDRMMVFQEFDQLFAWKTITDNVAFPLVQAGRARPKEARERALHYLEKVKLAKFRDCYPHMLSGGMKQRVAIARAMAMEPAVLLMDEPFAALDALTRRRMQDELLELWDTTRFTVLFVTHSIEEAIVVGSRILLLSPHPGRVRAELNCAAYDHSHEGSPEFTALQRKIHHMLFVEGEAGEDHD